MSIQLIVVVSLITLGMLLGLSTRYRRVVGSVGLVLLAAFCGFGFLASFEGSDERFLAFRFGYAALGLLSAATAVWLVVTRRSSGGTN